MQLQQRDGKYSTTRIMKNEKKKFNSIISLKNFSLLISDIVDKTNWCSTTRNCTYKLPIVAA